MPYRTALAPQIVPTLLANLRTRYPYHDTHLLVEGDSAHDPFAVHPAFGNSFDWHSSVHSHWSALRLLGYFSEHGHVPPEIGALRDAVAENMSAANIALETAYLKQRPAYERPYGWAWAMQLAATANLGEMAAALAQQILAWLDVLSEPVRHGVHSNTAFALWLMHEAAGKLEFIELQKIVEARALLWFGADRDWPQQWERSGNDFLSPGLCEAALMHAVLPHDEFESWLLAFLPSLDSDARIAAAVDVPAVNDGHVVHLHGLNLSRAAMLARIAPHNKPLLAAAKRLYDVSVSQASQGLYVSTHWLPTFAWMAADALDAASV